MSKETAELSFVNPDYLKTKEKSCLENPSRYRNQLVEKITKNRLDQYIESIKQIEKTKNKIDNAFVIEQKIKSGKWKITTTLDDKHLIYYAQTDGYANQAKEIYVIKEDDPTILLDTFVIEFKDLLTKNKYDVKVYNKDIAKRKDISLICSRVDEEYVHIVS